MGKGFALQNCWINTPFHQHAIIALFQRLIARCSGWRLDQTKPHSAAFCGRECTACNKADKRMCVNTVSKAILSREQKISSIARKWTYGGGAKYGSGGIGRASIEADIWADVELSKLAVWKNNEMKRCSLIGAGARASSPNRPPPFYEIGKSQNGSNSTSSETNDKPMTIDNSCIQDGGTRMCYNRQSQRYGNSGDSSGISSPYSGVSGQTGISGMSSPYD